VLAETAESVTTLLATAVLRTATDLASGESASRPQDPGPAWAPLLALATVDQHRRQARQRDAEDEEALMLMLVLLEVL
jgi:hypothetical protein